MAANANCQITISFSDNAVGSYATTLTVTDNATPATQIVALTATLNGVPQATLSQSLGAVSFMA